MIFPRLLTQANVPASSGERLTSLDLARCAAIALMVLAHFADQLVDPAEWSTPAGLAYGAIRGVTAPMFFVVSGWAFCASTLPAYESYLRIGPALFRRVRRAGALFFWGYALTLPWWAPGFPLEVERSLWAPFFAFGVLQTAGTALLAGHLLLLLSRSPRVFALLAAAMAPVVVLAAPAVQRWAAVTLGQPVCGAFDPGGAAGGFPLAPWLAYFFVGCAVGAFARQQGWSGAKMAVLTAAGACVSWLAGHFSNPYFTSHLDSRLFWTASPSLFLHRLATALVALSLAAAASLLIRRIPRPLALSGKHALSFYVGHMLLLWGTPLTPGLATLVSPTLPLWEVGLAAALCLVLLWAAVWTWTNTLALVIAWRRARFERVRISEAVEPAE
ncbi:MAG: heparan-alpha-glucosaminide N-acetyltransferase domain-containing protein [Myxococcaceae bacterium]